MPADFTSSDVATIYILLEASQRAAHTVSVHLNDGSSHLLDIRSSFPNLIDETADNYIPTWGKYASDEGVPVYYGASEPVLYAETQAVYDALTPAERTGPPPVRPPLDWMLQQNPFYLRTSAVFGGTTTTSSTGRQQTRRSPTECTSTDTLRRFRTKR